MNLKRITMALGILILVAALGYLAVDADRHPAKTIGHQDTTTAANCGSDLPWSVEYGDFGPDGKSTRYMGTRDTTMTGIVVELYRGGDSLGNEGAANKLYIQPLECEAPDHVKLVGASMEPTTEFKLGDCVEIDITAGWYTFTNPNFDEDQRRLESYIEELTDPSRPRLGCRD